MEGLEASRGSDDERRKGSPARRVSTSASRKRLVLGSLLGLAAGLSAVMAYLAATLPDVKHLQARNPETTAFIERYRNRRAAAGEDARFEWRWVPYDSISPHLKRAVVVAEDIGFFSHGGFAFDEIKVAIRQTLAGERKLRGASTLTQQLAKNLWLTPSRNPLRKVREALLTHQLEKALSKKRILELYLNVVEFGPGIYGAETAAQRYFGKSALDLSEREAALLAATLPQPSQWHPGSDSPAYLSYVADIEDRMARATFLWRRI